VKPLTTVVGMKCNDGIVLACDSQGSYEKGLEMKRLDTNKIFPIIKGKQPLTYLALAGSGGLPQIKLCVEELSENLGDQRFSDRQLRENVSSILLELHRKHNVERSRFLGLAEVEMFFYPVSLLGAKLEDTDGQTSFGLYLLEPEGWVYPIDEYETLGSGSALADFSMKQITRSMNAFHVTWSTVSVEDAIMFSSYVVNEVKTSDRYSGGMTKVAIIDSSGFRELSETEVSENYNKFLDIITNGLSRGLAESGLASDTFKKAYPPP
jgi:20S proteasome alpha/beta subunit